MPSHNSRHTVSVSYPSSSLLKYRHIFWNLHFHWKNKSGTEKKTMEMRWQRSLFTELLSGKRSESVSDGRPAGAPSRRTASVLCEGKVCSTVACGQCVWVKIRPVAALSERRQDTFESHERGLSGRLSARCCCRGREDETKLRGDGQYWEESDLSRRKTKPWYS